MTYINNSTAAIKATDSPSIDAFGRWRVSNPFTLFNSKIVHGSSDLVWDEYLHNAATSTFDDSTIDLNVTNGEYAIRQTRERFNYQPGKSQLIFMTGIMSHQAGIRKRIGYYDSTTTSSHQGDMDGLFFENNAGATSVNIAKAGSSTNTVLQGNWNIDKMDGTGASGGSLDWSKDQIFLIDFEWLGVGRVRWGVVIDGIPIYVHQSNHANISADGVYMITPNHAVRYEVRSDRGATGTLKCICSAVISEGGHQPQEIIQSYNLGGAATDDVDINSTDKTILLGIRLDTYAKDVSVIIKNLTIMCDSGSNFMWELQLNPTTSGAISFTNKSQAVEVMRSPSGGASNVTVTADGTILDSGYISNNSDMISLNIDNGIRLGSTFQNGSDRIYLVIQQATTTGEDYYASITWKELN